MARLPHGRPGQPCPCNSTVSICETLSSFLVGNDVGFLCCPHRMTCSRPIVPCLQFRPGIFWTCPIFCASHNVSRVGHFTMLHTPGVAGSPPAPCRTSGCPLRIQAEVGGV